MLLRSLRRGVVVPRFACGPAVAVLWSGVAVSAICGWMPPWWVPVPLWLGWLAVLLTACDVIARRLPDALTLTAYPVAAVLLAVADPVLLLGGLTGLVLFAGLYLGVRVLSPASMGPGDVKLAGSLGAVVGAVSVPAVLGCVAVAAALTLVVAARSRGGAVAHGPAMLAPAWLVTALPAAFGGPAITPGAW
ncbi:prepilin peptidase [Saccharopolyspora erythraea]|nr:prepilin peptidase [Saccharopolyspora erythraea]